MNESPPSAKQKRSLHLLSIDDHEHILGVMKACLTEYGHRVDVASAGRQGIELFRTATLKNEPYDVVITDLSMLDLNGDQVARIIKSESPNTPIVLMTAWGATEKHDATISPIVDAVISKPPDMPGLNDLLLRIAG
jgi:DNA-binding response OmpR family regulator